MNSLPVKQHTKNVSLILGSGGARGLAHIGIIRWLEEHNYNIQFISGSSMGALVGGMYAAGKLDEFEAWFKQLDNTDIIGLTDIAWDKSGLIKGDKLFNKFEEMFGNPNIEELRIPFTAVATDITHEKEVWLQQGSLLKAIRASISLPMIFTPTHHNGLTLIDGGVLNPIPIAPTFSLPNTISIAVNVGAIPANCDTELVTAVQKQQQEDSWLNSVTDFFDGMIERISPSSETTAPFSWDMYNVSNKAFDSMQNTIARQKIAAYPPDILLEISRDACGMLDFLQVNEMIELGYQTADRVLGHN